MQTFLAYPDFVQSAKVLDRQRLGKQRVECYQILNAIKGGSKGWVNHPCTKMWREHTNSLVLYGLAVCDEWIARGYKDTMRPRIAEFFNPDVETAAPKFLGSEDFHKSHRSKLIQKKPEFYLPLFPDTPDNLEYIWPV